MAMTEELGETIAASNRPVDVDDGKLLLDESAERYELRRSLGQGGMGTVDLCFDKRIGRELAVKQIRKESAALPSVQARFLREARVQGQLDHPAVVPVFDLGRAGEAPYFTMRRIHGVTLEEAIRLSAGPDEKLREKYARRRLLTAFVSACLAIDYAHSKGVLHRDLKPSNVMLGDFGEVYLLDWGVAKVLASKVEPQTDPIDARLSATQAGQMVGTLGYMSPEQLRGDHARVGPRSDVYSLGALLFEILARQPLHPRDSREALIASTSAEVDARPSQRPGGRDVPPELELICSRATALDPGRRYESARELATAVERYLDGDRDLERRRALAIEHSQKARALAARLHEPGRTPQQRVDDRKAALKELGQALSFDPGEPAARTALVEMLEEPPGELPPELSAELANALEQGRKTVNLVGASVYVFAAAVLAIAYFTFEIRSWPWMFALTAAVGLAGLNTWWVRRQHFAGRSPPTFFFGAIVIFTTTSLFGPLLVAPMFAVLNIIAWSIHAAGRYRWLAAGVSTAAWVLPYLLQLSGVFPRTYSGQDGDLLVHLTLARWVPGTGELLLVLSGMIVSVAAAAMVGAFRDQRYQAEIQRGWTAWQLRQLA